MDVVAAAPRAEKEAKSLDQDDGGVVQVREGGRENREKRIWSRINRK